MFLLFTFSFGDDFYVAAGALLGIELLGLLLKLFDYTWVFDKFKDPDMVDDVTLDQ